jgi:hypothetical protein
LEIRISLAPKMVDQPTMLPARSPKMMVGVHIGIGRRWLKSVRKQCSSGYLSNSHLGRRRLNLSVVEESLALEEKLDNESGTPSHYVLLHFGGSWFESSHRLPAQHDPNISKALYNKLSLSHTETVPPGL